MTNKRRRLNSEVKPSTTPESNRRHMYASRPRSTKNQHSRYKDIEIDFILELAYNYQLPNSSIILLYKACFAHKAKEIFGDTQVNYVKTIHGGKGENNIPALTGHDFKKTKGKMTPSAKSIIMKLNLMEHPAKAQDAALQVINSSVQPMEPTYPEVAAGMLSDLHNMLPPGLSHKLLPELPADTPMPLVNSFAMSNFVHYKPGAAPVNHAQNLNWNPMDPMPPALTASPAAEPSSFPAAFLEPSIPEYMANDPVLPVSFESFTPQVNADFHQPQIQLPPMQPMAYMTGQTVGKTEAAVDTGVAPPDEEQPQMRASSADYEAYGVLAPHAERIDVVMGNAFYKTHAQDPIINPCLPTSPFHAMNGYQLTGHAVMLKEYVTKR